MTAEGDRRLGALAVAFEARADATRAPAMAAYMKDQFAFFGIPSPSGGLPRRRPSGTGERRRQRT